MFFGFRFGVFPLLRGFLLPCYGTDHRNPCAPVCRRCTRTVAGGLFPQRGLVNLEVLDRLLSCRGVDGADLCILLRRVASSILVDYVRQTKPPDIIRVLFADVTTGRSSSRVIQQSRGNTIFVEERSIGTLISTANLQVRHGNWRITQLHGSP